ncbi:hypothetical protein COV15_00965 [Candidatus Woesearchaeota archaeon CG10_big_fil_rev_8_21_14_0_10_34_12]|nr:MAG: hypothetical protein COV15_00965 [Candidatus Woesearchaeota archaeon CG10_big_fil_rev_8_21_14_0_10_34_12]
MGFTQEEKGFIVDVAKKILEEDAVNLSVTETMKLISETIRAQKGFTVSKPTIVKLLDKAGILISNSPRNPEERRKVREKRKQKVLEAYQTLESERFDTLSRAVSAIVQYALDNGIEGISHTFVAQTLREDGLAEANKRTKTKGYSPSKKDLIVRAYEDGMNTFPQIEKHMRKFGEVVCIPPVKRCLAEKGLFLKPAPKGGKRTREYPKFTDDEEKRVERCNRVYKGKLESIVHYSGMIKPRIVGYMLKHGYPIDYTPQKVGRTPAKVYNF